MKHLRVCVFFLFPTCAFILGGCASSTPAPKYQKALAKADYVGNGDSSKVKVTADTGIEILESEKTKIAERIENFIKQKQGVNGSHTPSRTYSVELNITRYERGNAFARAMLAGLGQIHIDGTIKVIVEETKEVVGEFYLKKTFAWGGIYGASTSMEDIERTFASAVAGAVTGKRDEEKK